MPPVSPRCTTEDHEPLVEPLRTAVSAEMAKSGHSLHPAIYRSDEPELGVVVAACGGHREARCENEHSCHRYKCNHPIRRACWWRASGTGRFALAFGAPEYE